MSHLFGKLKKIDMAFITGFRTHISELKSFKF